MQKTELKNVQQWTLPNGMRVVAENFPHLRSVSIGVWVGVGSGYESREENGMSHFLEHMAFKGTTNRDSVQIARESDLIGGQVNAFTGKDVTCFYAKVVDDDTEEAFSLLSDLTINPTISAEEMDKERGVILEEISIDEDTPDDLVHDYLLAASFGSDTPLGRTIMGTAEGVSGFTRDELMLFRSKNYAPQNMVLSICGSYDISQIKELSERYFGGFCSKEYVKRPFPSGKLHFGRQFVRSKVTEQLHLALGYPGTPLRCPEMYAHTILLSVLGASMSSRLVMRIREELGMAYTIESYAQSYQTCGITCIYAGVSPENGQQVVDEILKENRRLVKDGITKDELSSAIGQCRRNMLLGLESSMNIMQQNGRDVLYGNPIMSVDECLSEMESLTSMDMVMDFARNVLSVTPSIAVLGPDAHEMDLTEAEKGE